MATARSFVPLFFLSFIFASCSIFTHDPERAAVNHIAQKKWSAAESDLRKALRKDTLNVEAKFLYAQYFLLKGNPTFDPDSSYRYTRKALTALSQTSPKQKERLQRLSIDSASIVAFRSRVDSAAFEKARQQNTEAAYQYFIDRYSSAVQRPEAIELRDEVAYLDALRKNTPAAFKQYFEMYPNSNRVKDAEGRYEQLVFKERTTSAKLDDYKSFLAEFPHSTYRAQAEQFIFETSTSSGLIKDYFDFVSQYPTGSQSAKARNILYYLFRDAGMKRPASLDNDSLRMLDEQNKGYWVPFYKNGLYGFMNDDGAEMMSPRFESIDSTYLCGEVTRDFLVTSSGVYSRNGALLLKKTPTRVIDLGKGFLGLVDGTCQTVVHQSGFQVGDNCVADARVVADQFIALKMKGAWNVFAFNAKQLLPSSYDDVTAVDKVIVLTRYGKRIVVRASEVASVSATKPLDESHVFDEVRAWGEGNLWVKNGVLEGVIGQDLQFVIPLDRQVLIKTSFGFIRKKDTRLQVTGILPSLEAQTYDDVHDYGDWLELIANNHSVLYKVSQKKVVANNLDSIWIKNRVVFGTKGDSLNVYVGASRLSSFERSAPINFIRGSDSVVYFWVPEKKNKIVYEASHGKRLFSSDFEDIMAVGYDRFIFWRKKKVGLLRSDGKVVIPPEYETIVQYPKGYLALLLKDKKFGLYDLANQRLIKPDYDLAILPYSRNYYIGHKGGYGIIKPSGEPVTGFDFDEIKYWNDTAAWVKKNYSWSILSIKDQSLKLQRIRSFQTVKDHDGEMIVRVQQDNYFGIVSNRKGIVIPPTFTDVLNIGSVEKPFYFTEKRVEEAGIFVVIYYNSLGKLVRKQVYEEEEYEKIYCEN